MQFLGFDNVEACHSSERILALYEENNSHSSSVVCRQIGILSARR